MHVAGIPNNFQGSGGSGCANTCGCALVNSVVDGNLPVSVFNQSLARILYQEQRFGMLGCNDTPAAASCKNPGGVGSDRSGTALLPTGSTGQLGTTTGDAAIVERMAEEGATLLKNNGNVLPIASRIWPAASSSPARARTTPSPTRPGRPRPASSDVTRSTRCSS